MVTKRELAGVLQTVPIAAGLDGLARGTVLGVGATGFEHSGAWLGLKLGWWDMGDGSNLCMACLTYLRSLFLQEKRLQLWRWVSPY